MIKIGFWKSNSKFSREDDNLPDPNTLIDSDFWKQYDKAFVVNYLKNAKVDMAYRGYSTCRICGALNGTRDLTDGKYVFPDGLYHYVKEHDVKLPIEFVEHILRVEKPMVDIMSYEAKDEIDKQLITEYLENKWGKSEES